MASQVLIVRLLSGEEIIADVDKGEKVTKLGKPMQVHLARAQNPQDVNIHLVPFLPLSRKPDIEVDNEKILFTYQAAEPIENKYRENFGSGIILPENSGLITK